MLALRIIKCKNQAKENIKLTDTTIRLQIPNQEAYNLGNDLAQNYKIRNLFMPYFINGMHALYQAHDGDVDRINELAGSHEELSSPYFRGGNLSTIDQIGRGLVWLAKDRDRLPEPLRIIDGYWLIKASDIVIQTCNTRLSVAETAKPIEVAPGQTIEVSRGYTVQTDEPSTPESKFNGALIRAEHSYALLHRFGTKQALVPEVPASRKSLSSMLFETAVLLDKATESSI